MSRTVVTISDRNGDLVAWLDKASAQLANSKKPEPLGYRADSLPGVADAAQLAAYGDTLVKGLRQHPAIGHMLDDIFAAGPAQSHTLCFGIEAQAGQQIRWESLRDGQGRYIALEGRCHIGRIAEEASSREAGVRAFAPPLKLLAFISGAKLDATQEWAALAGAIDKAVAAGLPVQAQVHIGQPVLLAQAQAEVQAGQHTKLIVKPMPADQFELEDAIHAAQPHVLHFFCHGRADMGAAFLELATLADHALGRDNGSINIALDTLADHAAVRKAWLIVLNCCSGAQAADQLDSMAYRMVSQGGLAAAIGMLEPVLVGEANRFCAALYPELFRALDAVLSMAPGAPPVTVDLSPAMSRPRRALRDMPPAAAGNGASAAAGPGAAAPTSRWTLPVLYLQDRPFEVFVPMPVAGGADNSNLIRQKAELTAGMLRALPPDTPDAVRDQMLATLAMPPVVPPAMRPDRWGVTGQGGAGGW